MQAFSYVPVNGRAVARILGGSYLLDTGLPRSLADRPLSLYGRELSMDREVFGLTLDDMTALLGIPLDGVLGANLFDEFEVLIDPLKHRICLDGDSGDCPLQLPVENLAGTAQVELAVEGRKTRGLLEIGLSVSLVHPRATCPGQASGHCRELFGYIGERKLPFHHLPVSLGDHVLHLRCAEMPPEVSAWADLANIEFALGYELLEHYAVALSMSRGTLGLSRLH